MKKARDALTPGPRALQFAVCNVRFAVPTYWPAVLLVALFGSAKAMYSPE
jgi:hypothetical protein